MSHLTLQRSESPSEEHRHQHQHASHSAPSSPIQDSPTIGRAAVDYLSISVADTSSFPLPSLSISPEGSSSASRSQRKPAPSPLQTSTAVSPPSSASPNRSKFPSSAHDSFAAASVSHFHVDTDASTGNRNSDIRFTAPSYRRGDFSPPVTPVVDYTRGPSPNCPPPNVSNRTFSEPAATTKPIGTAAASLSRMASGSLASELSAASAAPRNSSIDSAISAISSRTNSQQGQQDVNADVANLVRAAGTPEAVIQYLLKEKNSQAQQNAQLWRLVDKQRAMILGLNKDLERALKDKEKYRKKLKDVMAAYDENAKRDIIVPGTTPLPQVDVDLAKDTEGDSPASASNLDSDSVKHSPIDMNLAPYPITPPADQLTTNGPPSAVAELLDPSHSMPKASEHALDSFDHDEEDRAALEEKKAADAVHDLPIQLSLPPSRSVPSEPPRMPPPKPPVNHPSSVEETPLMDSGISQFPPPSAPPPRKPPPAPLQLKKDTNVAVSMPPEEDNDSSSDYDSLLEVDELPILEKRGRRRTREEDDRDREILAQKEAEARSLSKKSKKGSQKGTPISSNPGQAPAEISASPRMVAAQPMLPRENVPASLAGVLSGVDAQTISAPLMSPGLPASPRPLAMRPPLHSPSLSPRSLGPNAIPLSPRAPRQPIPLPPNTPKSNASPADALNLSSPKPLHITKEKPEPSPSSPTGSNGSLTDKNQVYRGFVTEEYPDLLLPPNALPSISVRVASSRMKPSRASLMSLTQLEEDPVFTLAIYARSQSNELWRVEKDTASLGKLDQRMKQCASCTAKTPDRSLFNGHAPAKLDARRVALNQYLDELLDTPLDLPTALELCRYLSTNTLPPDGDDVATAVDPNAQPEKKGPGGRPFKDGYLTKRGKNFGGWKARYFVLDGPNLKYYETPGGAHLGTIKLQNAQIGKQSQQTNDGSPSQGPNGDELDNQYRHAFLVLEPKKKDSSSHVKHVLCAESDKERDQWVEALLRWIDYRDPNDEAHRGSNADRHGSSSKEHINGMNAKKKMYGQNKPQASRNNSEDALIGMSYDSAKQGSIPDGAPRRRGTASPEPQERAAPPTKTISAPRDPQIISDSSSWGGKPTLAPPGPSLEEKKQRKRSFFGFGPKARSSSDDQDPLYSSSPSGASGQGYAGPVRQVFGAPLAEAVRYNGPVDANVPIPAVVYRCIQYLDVKNAILEEGIFRLSGSNVVIKQLRERYNTEGDVNLLTDETYYDIHAVASLLKLYLRELPTTILTRDLHMQFVAVTELANHKQKIMGLSELVQKLPLANETLLKYLLAFLIKIINNADMNKMTVRNVGIVFSPTLNIPAPVFALLLQNYEGVFGLSPEEYELPSPESEPQHEPQPRRPSTAGTASPHRQRIVEQAHQRSTPTPPPALLPGGGRSTATPPPRQQYEPQYLAQQGMGSSQTFTRPAYESGFNVPPGWNPNMMPASVMKQPTYDQPHYGSSYEQDYGAVSNAAYEQPQSNKARRRESSMFMMNQILNQQSSNSRLREETRMR